LGHGWRSTDSETKLTNDEFAFPTALVALRGRLLITHDRVAATLNAGGEYVVDRHAGGGPGRTAQKQDGRNHFLTHTCLLVREDRTWPKRRASTGE
jgi:hypothetical protein